LPTDHTFQRGTEVKTPVSDGKRNRWFLYGTVIDIDGPWITVLVGSMTCVYPAHELLPA